MASETELLTSSLAPNTERKNITFNLDLFFFSAPERAKEKGDDDLETFRREGLTA